MIFCCIKNENSFGDFAFLSFLPLDGQNQHVTEYVNPSTDYAILGDLLYLLMHHVLHTAAKLALSTDFSFFLAQTFCLHP